MDGGAGVGRGILAGVNAADFYFSIKLSSAIPFASSCTKRNVSSSSAKDTDASTQLISQFVSHNTDGKSSGKFPAAILSSICFVALYILFNRSSLLPSPFSKRKIFSGLDKRQ